MARIEDLNLGDPDPQPEPTPKPAAATPYPPAIGTGPKTLRIPFPTSVPPVVPSPAEPYAGTPRSDPPQVAQILNLSEIVPTPPPLPAAPPPKEITAADVPEGFCYISGAAGTGKTWLARELVTLGDGDAILTATTGIAAVNLGDASTINSVLSYFDTQSLLEHYATGFLQTRLRQLRRSGVRRIVLDEVSMLDANQLTALCQALDEVNFSKSYDQSLGVVNLLEHDDGIMSLTLVGDFAQLPPVEAPFAFESPEWARFRDTTLKLETIRRQGDHAFIQALQAVRKGRAQEAVGIFEPRMVPSLDFAFQGTTIVALNAEVDRINLLRFNSLPGEVFTWGTIRSGEQEKDWIRLIPNEVRLKPGALVMILANKPYPKLDEDDYVRGFSYVNGDLAHVVQKEANGVRVMLRRTFEEVVVTPTISEKRAPTGKKNPRWEVKGSCTRMPLRLAYATTVHKSQGLSLDEVQISIANWMFGKPGMMYVALSRCRTLQGLRIVGNPKMFVSKCSVEKKITAFL